MAVLNFLPILASFVLNFNRFLTFYSIDVNYGDHVCKTVLFTMLLPA